MFYSNITHVMPIDGAGDFLRDAYQKEKPPKMKHNGGKT